MNANGFLDVGKLWQCFSESHQEACRIEFREDLRKILDKARYYHDFHPYTLCCLNCNMLYKDYHLTYRERQESSSPTEFICTHKLKELRTHGPDQ